MLFYVTVSMFHVVNMISMIHLAPTFFLSGDNRLILNDFDPDADNQKWSFCDDRVQNRETGQVLDIAQADDSEGAEICMWDWGGDDHQTFSINYE